MKRYLLVALLLLVFFKPVFAQVDSADVNIKDIHYEPITEDYFADYKNAKLIVNYFCSDGISVTNRYSYEIVVIDSTLMMGFDSPETEALGYISYEKRQMLTHSQFQALKAILLNSDLTQKKIGIPRPDVSAHTKEVLIVRYGDINIAGGMFHYNMLQEDQPKSRIEANVARQRRLTSSIGGDYDAVIHALEGYFTDLTGLMNQALKIK
ncbi:MAG TPA: hypothetical protein VNZ45_07395 [Bacteroidia bacterium]|nr:hypothetical protein [Bacteroidia bacterium]